MKRIGLAIHAITSSGTSNGWELTGVFCKKPRDQDHPLLERVKFLAIMAIISTSLWRRAFRVFCSGSIMVRANPERMG
jgi:hypothetical protein